MGLHMVTDAGLTLGLAESLPPSERLQVEIPAHSLIMTMTMTTQLNLLP